MNNLFKLVLLVGILCLSSCGKEQSGQESSTSSAAPAPAAPSAAMESPAAATSGMDSSMGKMEGMGKMGKMEGMGKMGKMEKPAWARLEQNVYHYPQ